MGKLGIDPVLVLAQVVNFLLLLFILRRFLYRPILNVLEKRRESVEKIEQRRVELDQLKAEMANEKEKIINETRKESDKILDGARVRGEKIRQQIEEDAQRRVKEILDRAGDEALLKEREMRAQLIREVGQVALTVAERVLQGGMTDQQRDRILHESVLDFSGEKTPSNR